MDKKEQAVQILQEEFAGLVEAIDFRGPYEDEEFFIRVTLNLEPPDVEAREFRARDRIRELGGGHVGVFVDCPDEVTA